MAKMEDLLQSILEELKNQSSKQDEKLEDDLEEGVNIESLSSRLSGDQLTGGRGGKLRPGQLGKDLAGRFKGTLQGAGSNIVNQAVGAASLVPDMGDLMSPTKSVNEISRSPASKVAEIAKGHALAGNPLSDEQIMDMYKIQQNAARVEQGAERRVMSLTNPGMFGGTQFSQTFRQAGYRLQDFFAGENTFGQAAGQIYDFFGAIGNYGMSFLGDQTNQGMNAVLQGRLDFLNKEFFKKNRDYINRNIAYNGTE